MKKLFLSLVLTGLTLAAFTARAQNTTTQAAVEEAAIALASAEDKPEQVAMPKYWTATLVTNINFGQTYLSQWTAGGYNNYSLSGTIDGRVDFNRDKFTGITHLVMDYGFLYSADKPILQKVKDRIYFESKWGYNTPVKNLAYSASLDFRTQFHNNYDYKTPASDGTEEPTTQDWLDARKLKSGFFAPAYINLGIGALWTPAPWFSLNVAPISGGAVIVDIPELRYAYGMDLKSDNTHGGDRKAAYTAGDYGQFFGARYELGISTKIDMGWVINNNFSITTQATVFWNYLTPKVVPRINWDNKIVWKVARFFSLHLSTYLIYDPLVMVKASGVDGTKTLDRPGVQFKEYFEVGFTYSLTTKKD